jgi:hypothetical protein
MRVQTTLNNKETTDKKEVGRNLYHHLFSYLNVRVLQVRVVSSELTMTFLVRLTFTNWARHVHIKIQILSLPTTNTIFVIDNYVEFVACFVCCVVNIVQHIIYLTIPDEIRKPACSEVHLSVLSTSLHYSFGQSPTLRACQRIMCS